MPGIFSWVKSWLSPQAPSPSDDKRPSRPSRNMAQPLPQTSPGDRLNNHLFCWLLDCGPRQLETPSPFTRKVVAEIELRLQKNRLEELPRQPLTLPTLLRTLSRESTTRKEVVDIILSDASLTDQVLQVANSPFFKTGDQTIETVDQAVFVLGLDGIRNVVSASVMRPMLAARNSTESTFTQRVWRWGLGCARASELVALSRQEDSTTCFMAGLLPALAYLTLRREVQTIVSRRYPGQQATPQMCYQVMTAFGWITARKAASAWGLPERYHDLLNGAESPADSNPPSSLNDGLILGTREILRNAHQRNLPEEELESLVALDPEQLTRMRQSLSRFLAEGPSIR